MISDKLRRIANRKVCEYGIKRSTAASLYIRDRLTGKDQLDGFCCLITVNENYIYTEALRLCEHVTGPETADYFRLLAKRAFNVAAEATCTEEAKRCDGEKLMTIKKLFDDRAAIVPENRSLKNLYDDHYGFILIDIIAKQFVDGPDDDYDDDDED